MSVQVFGRLSYLGSQTSQIFFFLAELSFHRYGSWTGLLQNPASANANTTESTWSGAVLVWHLGQILYSTAQGLRSTRGPQLMLQGLACWAPHPAWAEAARAWAPSGFSSAVARVEGTWLIPPGSHPRGKRASVFSSHGLFLGCSHKSLN